MMTSSCRQASDLEFEVHDIVQTPLPISSPDVLFCRFLLTHLSSLGQALASWASTAAPGAKLIIHETETLETDNSTLRRYYDLLSQMQQHYGQILLVGAVLNEFRTADGGLSKVIAAFYKRR